MATNDISALVKFCNSDTALKILNSQSLRWSAPHFYNDPFELDHLSGADFNSQGLITGIIKEAIGMLFGPSEPTGKSNRLITAISRWRDDERFGSEDEAEVVLKQLLGQVAEQQQVAIDAYVATWKTFASTARVCSFVDKPTNIRAWQRFADNHSGIALKFACGENTALGDPQRVKYSATPTFVTNLKEQINVCYGRQSQSTPDEFIDKLLNKNKEDSSEHEWRCFEKEANSIDTDSQLWYKNKTFSAPELKAVYFGLTTSPHAKQSLITLIKQKYRNTKVFQAETLPGRYEIDFSAVGIR